MIGSGAKLGQQDGELGELALGLADLAGDELVDADAFRAWYHSPAYQAVIGMRTAATDGFAVLAEGLA